MSASVAALFVRSDSYYFDLAGVDAYDIRRDALSWPGGCSVIAHPPCRGWGKYHYKAKCRPGERELAVWAVSQVRRYGGVLEHPQGSALWRVAGLPRPGCFDHFGGFTLRVFQSSWGHLADKETLLYVVGCHPLNVPPIPSAAPGRVRHVENLSRRQREMSPPAFASWLVDLASRCNSPCGVLG